MKILVLNYRDMNHPQAGGAEVHLHRIFGRLQKLGHEVLLVSTKFPGCLEREKVEGIDVLRLGTDLTFQFLIPLKWRAILKEFSKSKYVSVFINPSPLLDVSRRLLLFPSIEI